MMQIDAVPATQVQQGKSRNRLWWGVAMAAVYLAVFLLQWGIKPYSDDLFYAAMVQEHGFFGFIAWYYMTWSGRVFSNALSALVVGRAFWLWKLLNPAFVVLLALGMARLSAAKPNVRRFICAALLLAVLGPGISDYAVFWATGSMYYLWPATAVVWALVPYVDLALRGEKTLRRAPLVALLALVGGMANEQLAACLLGFMAVALVWHAVRTKELPRRYLAPVAAGIAAVVVLLAAPGNGLRFDIESGRYLEEHGVRFDALPLGQKLANGAAWSGEMLFGILYFTLIILFALALRHYVAKGGRFRLACWALLALSVAFAFPLQTEPLFAFVPLTRPDEGLGAFAMHLVPYVYWCIFFVVLAYLLYKSSFFKTIALLAAAASLLVLTFSPTLYASGERTVFVAGVILSVLVLGYLKDQISTSTLVGLGMFAVPCVLRLATRLAVFA